MVMYSPLTLLSVCAEVCGRAGITISALQDCAATHSQSETVRICLVEVQPADRALPVAEHDELVPLRGRHGPRSQHRGAGAATEGDEERHWNQHENTGVIPFGFPNAVPRFIHHVLLALQLPDEGDVYK
jgi:hypothetical protein